MGTGTQVRVFIKRFKKYLSLGKFGVLCFLVTTVLRFAVHLITDDIWNLLRILRVSEKIVSSEIFKLILHVHPYELRQPVFQRSFDINVASRHT